MSNVQNLNKEFSRIVQSIRKFMPYIAVFLLLAVYAVAAWAEGFFLAQLMPANIALAYCIGGAVQLTRGTLVFFPQLNPTRPTLSLRGELIAIAMGLISVGSIVGLVHSTGLAVPVAVSLSILMLAGVGVELFLLKEIKFSTHMELFRNKSWWGEIQDYHLAEKKLAMFLDKLRDATDSDLEAWAPTSQAPAATPAPTPDPSPADPPTSDPNPTSRSATLDDVRQLMEEALKKFAQGGAETPKPTDPPATTTPPAAGAGRSPIAGMKLGDIYNLVKDQGVGLMDLTNKSLEDLEELLRKAGKLPAPAADPATTVTGAPATANRDRHLRAAKASIQAAIEWEKVNHHSKAKQDYETAHDLIRLAYPGATDDDVSRIEAQLVEEIHQDEDIRQNGEPLDLTEPPARRSGKKSPPLFGSGNGVYQ